jgi:hypothetical protein
VRADVSPVIKYNLTTVFADMNWIKVADQLPPVDPNTGESEYMFVSRGGRSLPQVASYSNGLWSRKGWTPSHDIGETIPLYSGRGAKRHLTFTHWARIVFPKD